MNTSKVLVRVRIFQILVIASCIAPLGAVAAPSIRTSPGAKAKAEAGQASYYADKYHGKPTASGELFDMHQLTAAHPTLKFGTMVRVTNAENNRFVTVRINDRGPFIRGRIIDLSLAAAQELQMVENGVVPVTIEIVR